MKLQTTIKRVKEYYFKIIGIGYCNAQYLLHYQNPFAYHCGVYGWNFDVYDINGVAICTGYRNFPGKRVNYDMLQEYENKAKEIVYNYSIPYEEREKQVNALLKEFIKKNFDY